MTLRSILYRHLYLGDEFATGEQFMREACAYNSSHVAELLIETLEHARRNVPHYQNFGSNGCCELADFPLLTKPIIRENYDSFLSTGSSRSELNTASTGGSTGVPLTVWYDDCAKIWMRVTEDYYFREFFGFDQTEVPTVVFWANMLEVWGRRRGFRKRLQLWLTRTRLYGSTYVAPGDLAAFTEGINEVRPLAIKGYANTIYQVALYARDHNIRMHRPKFIFTSAERLQPFIREIIEEVFQCSAYDFYACREFGPVAGQCQRGRLHLFSFHVHAELLDDAQEPAAPGCEARLVLTGLRNRAMPLIRYDIGDVAVKGDTCDCGSSLPVLERIAGRMYDYFRAADGSLVYGGYFTGVLMGCPWIERFQVIQNEVDDIEVSYVLRGTENIADRESMTSRFRQVLGENCKVTWRQVPSIALTQHGKMLYVFSRIGGQYLVP